MFDHAKYYQRIKAFAKKHDVPLHKALAQFDIGFEIELEHKEDFADCKLSIEDHVANIIFDHWEESGENFMEYYPKLLLLEASLEKTDYGQKYYATADINGEQVKIFLVDTEKLKKDHNSFTEGGHHIAREDLRFIPKGEIWVDDSFKGENLFGILLHEVHEYGRMWKEKETYEVAHEKSEEVEVAYRNIGFSPLGITYVIFKNFTENRDIAVPFKLTRINQKYFKEIHGMFESMRLINLNYVADEQEAEVK
jgi:hypothetical protein